MRSPFRRFCLFLAVALLLPNSPLLAASLDLTSTQRTESAAGIVQATARIVVNGRPLVVTPTTLLTPAERAAVEQVVSTGRQSLVIGGAGAAMGGSLNIGRSNGSVGSFNLPHGVTAVQNAGFVQSFTVSGDFTNSGKFFAVSTNPGFAAANIEATNIVNRPGALLSSVLPAGGLPGVRNPIPNLDLNLTATAKLINDGVISSSRNLGLNAPVIRNAGTVSADKNININSKGDISIDAGGGTFKAVDGSINVRDASYAGSSSIYLNGGNYIANEINLHSGTGSIIGHVENVSGTLNTDASYAHLGASSPLLTLGNIEIDGDPTYYNDSGNISLSGNIQVNESLAIIASGNVTATSSGLLISAQSDAGGGTVQGHDITIIAGANVSGTGPTSSVSGTPPASGQATGDVTVDGASATGGNVNLPFVSIDARSTCAGCSGGNVVLAAYASNGSGGQIRADGSIRTTGTASNGNVQVIAGGSSPSGTLPVTYAIALGSINNGSNLASGDVTITTAQPQSSDGNPIVFATDGTISSGNSLVPSATLSAGNIYMQSTAARNLTVVSGQNVLMSDSINAGVVALTAENGSIFYTNGITATGAFNVQTTRLGSYSSSPAISATSVTITSGTSLDISSVQINALRAHVVANNGLTLEGLTSSNCPTYIYAGDSLTVNAGATVTGSTLMQITTPSISLVGNLHATAIEWHPADSASAGTIFNPSGDVVIPANLIYSGKSLAILASGNILAAPSVTSINLSSTLVSGGNLTMFAGVDFIDSATGLAPSALSKTPVAGTNYTIVGWSTSGGSILLPAVNINLGSTSANPSNNHSGSLFAVANEGTLHMGIVSLGSISSTSAKGTAGSVHIIGANGIITKSITNTAANGNAILLEAGTPSILDGDVEINNGLLQGKGTVVASYISKTLAAGVNVHGSINTSASVLNAGDVWLRGDGPIVVDGTITAVGTGQPDIYRNQVGGKIDLFSSLSYVSTGSINVSAKTVNSPMPNVSNLSSGFPGIAGWISILGDTGITVNGSLIATGAPNPTGSGLAGFGGIIILETGSSSGTDAQRVGNIRITGFIRATGGSAPNGYGGAGGYVKLVASTVQVLGSSGGYSINTTLGHGQFSPFSSGNVVIKTNALQAFPSNFDLTSNIASIAAQPGAMFTVGTANPVNGTAASILARDTDGPLSKSLLPGGYVTVTTAGITVRSVEIDIAGTLLGTVVDAGTDKRVVLTPVGAVNYFLTQHNTPTITPSGGTISVDQIYLPAKFTAFNLPQGFTLEISGPKPLLTLPVTAKLGGNINFIGTLGSPTIAMIDFGTGSGNIPVSTHIDAGTSALILATNSSVFNNNGLISAQIVLFGRTVATPLTVNNIGVAADIVAAGGIVLSGGTMSNFAVNFNAKSSNFSSAVKLLDLEVPTKFSNLALNASKVANKDPLLNISFNLTDSSASPITAKFGGLKILQSISLRTTTPLEITTSLLGADTTARISSTSTLKIDDLALIAAKGDFSVSASSITIGNKVGLSAGSLKSTDTGSGVISVFNITTKGALTLSATGPGGITIAGTNDLLESTAKDLTLSAFGGSIALGGDNVLEARGGRLIVVAKGSISDSGGNTYHARGSDAVGNTGGGIYFGSGVTSNIGPTVLTAAFAKKAGVVDGYNPTGVDASGITGVFWVRTKDGGVVNLAGPPVSTVGFTKGAMVFDATGASALINLQGATLLTQGLKPVGASAAEQQSDFVVDVDEDADHSVEINSVPVALTH